MKSQQHIARDQFASLLDERSETSVPVEVARHLEECPDCRARLEQAAADPSWWNCLEKLDDSDLHSTFASPAVDRLKSAPADLDSGVGGDPEWDHAELLDAPRHPEMLGQLNQFEIERVIGRGGMGVVFKGFDRELHRPVAIKLMSPHLAYNATARKRFEREARAAAAVVHPNVIPIHGVSQFKNQPLIVMPLISGSSLQSLVEKQGPLDTKDVVRIGLQMAAGLSAAHDQGLIHRDIKPANILLEQDVSRVVITDFGLARAADELAMTQTGWLAGTPHYMSPEQARGGSIDTRSDLFSLGGVLYFIATGREPFRAEKPVAVLHKICHEPVVPPNQINSDIPQTLSDIIERLLEKNPHNRFAAAARVQKLFEEYLTELQQPNRVQRPLRIVTRRQVQRRWRIAQIAALFVLIVAAGASGGWLWKKYGPAGPLASERSENRNDSWGFDFDRSKLEGLISPNAFDNELRSIDEQLDVMERRLNLGPPLSMSGTRPPRSTEPPFQSELRRVESVQAILGDAPQTGAMPDSSNQLSRPAPNATFYTSSDIVGYVVTTVDSMRESVVRWYAQRFLKHPESAPHSFDSLVPEEKNR